MVNPTRLQKCHQAVAAELPVHEARNPSAFVMAGRAERRDDGMGTGRNGISS